MADMKITGISGQGPLEVNKPGGKPDAKGFQDALKEAISKVDKVNNEAEKAIVNLAEGGDITEAVIAMQKADMSFQVMLEVRNKLLDAYQEVMRTSV